MQDHEIVTVNSTDVLSASSTDYVTGEGRVLERVVRSRYTEDAADTTLQTISERKLLEGSSWQRTTQADGGVFTQWDEISGSTRTVHGLQSVTGTQSQTRVYQNGLLTSETPPGMTSAVTYTYNGFGQVLTIVHPLNGTITRTYDTAGRVLTQGQTGGDTVTYAYNSQGQVTSETHSDSSTTTYTYDAQGRVLTQGGTAGYPLGYEYDAMGRLWKLHTYRGGSADDVTTWAYAASSGVLLSKTDAATTPQSMSYTYDAAGRVLTRTWARGVATTYSYDGIGRQTGIDYSDSTPDVSITYDRAGRRTGTTDAAGTHAYAYDDAASGGRVSSWSVSGTGAWSGLSVGYGYTTGKRSSRTTSLGSITLPTVNYTYDAASGRMSGVSASDFAVSYRYDAATGWNSGVTYTSGLSSTRTADALGRLDAITWSVGGVTVSGHDYTLNALNRRTAAQRQDGSSWSYGYNARGEVTSAAKGTEPGKQFAFAYDGIGNRTSSSVSSIASTTTLRTTGYSANALNQYDSITHPQPGWLVLRGSANAGVTVTIDGHATLPRSGTLWYYEESVDNSNGSPVNRVVDIAASNSTGGLNNGPVTTHQKGMLFIPPPTEVPTYDLDGNLTSDARWNYVWNGENRLVAQEEKTGFTVLPTSSAPVKRTRLEFDYDAQGRRIGKQTFIATGSGGFVLQQSIVHLYDGWNMIAEIDTTSSAQLLRSYEWGVDISGTMAGAGGVGGLLMVRCHTAPSSGVYAPCYDGNGNIAELVNLANGSVSAHYEYGAFGETISMDGGTVAEVNPFRFSTKFLDAETGLYYYGYRYYDAVNGRWLNRDPIKERGGINLYGMVGNDPVNQVDILGLATFEIVLKRNLTGNFAVYGELSASLKLTRAEEAKFACCKALVPLKFITLETVGKPLKGVGTYTPYTDPENSWANGTGANGTGFPKNEDGEFIGRFTSIRGKLEFITMMQWISPGSGRLPQKPSDMSQSDYDDIVNQEFHPDVNSDDGRNIHFGPTANHSTGCVLIGTSYIPVISPFDGDRFGLAAKNGIGTQYRVPGFGLQDTIDSQFKLLRAVQCAKKQGAKLQYRVLNKPPPLHPDAQAMPHKENEPNAPPRAFPLNF